MMLDGYTIVDKNIITFSDEAFDQQDQVQPNGVDLRVSKIYEVRGKSTIPREGKAEADFIIREAVLKDGYWTLSHKSSGVMYYVDFFEIITVPGGYCGIIETRSSLVRSGIDVNAGIYDSGFTGRCGGVLRVFSDVTIEYGAKLAQLTVWKSNFRGALYSGRYQNTNSQTAIGS